MPIYEYQCTECGELKEALQKMSDPLLTDCPACGKAALRKKVSAAAFRLKGSGWYETDFKSGKKKNLAGDEKGESKSGDKSSEKGGEKGGEKTAKTTSDAKSGGDSTASKKDSGASSASKDS